ncbi:hypothetical protein QJS10_CPA01g02744 [Acorus calamus]|uniref:Uncharacterized protein n=1 Tax=Acorus calamus TaxID=4465 RepID=A0AAV9FIY9_ACOCL|nr:hypothetical protein QJS10_CPA01g02744 [Acorus calamus]
MARSDGKEGKGIQYRAGDERDDQCRRLNTTRSSQFLGLRNQQGLWFSDFNLDPIPSKWKSVCEFGGFNSYLEDSWMWD